MNYNKRAKKDRFHMINENQILSERYVVSILIHILENGEVICSDLDSIIKSPTTRNDIVKRVAASRLLTIRTVTKPRKTYFLSLTANGERIARVLQTAQKMFLGEEIEEDDHNRLETPSTYRNNVKS
jgi:hypothetical protein